ncbi:GtrA family protein [Burkholderia vietnamiensis]|uniref:GtrA family protein n=1 Tax=Burkholderia vietnamiensis TaxID=60552 RepID=UPI00075CBBDD|nr:GtrA family protein [Burkholderia vietnamiensis]KVF03241.1 polysaccharide synthesis protein GtrA [Burkholderia vietnamiensis]
MMLSRYCVVSVVSLGVDWALFVVLTATMPIDAGISAWLAYLGGGGVNYLLSRRVVFRSDATGRRQLGEALLFAASCALGSLLTGGIVHIASARVGTVAAKWIAVAVSFVTLYLVRRIVVFRTAHVRVADAAAAPAAAHREAGAGAHVEATVR